jgi:hypothetical protein
MVVYSLMKFYPYEGTDLLGVFATEADAVAYANTLETDPSYDGYSDLGILESELGAPVDLDAIKYLVAE